MQRLEVLQSLILSGQEFIYSVPVGPTKEGETRVHRHPKFAHELLVPPPHIRNLADFWDESLSKHRHNLALENITYQQLNSFTLALGSWMLDNKHEKVYLYAKNSPEWTITDIACWNYGVVNIPLYDTLGAQAFHHIVKLTQGTAIFSTNDMTSNMVQFFSENKQNISTIVYMDTPSSDNIQKVQKLGLKAIQITKCLQHAIRKRPQITLSAHLTYSFTSGTTGLPKGVVGTHRMVISQCLSMKGSYEYTQTDVHLSFLPIAHTYERFVTWSCIMFGCNIKYSQFPITEITKDFARAKPTTIPMVPRLLNKFYPLCKEIYDKEKSSTKIKGLFGGRLRLMVTGSAPISPQVLIFFRKMLECEVREGYGQTQTTAASYVTQEGDTNYGHVGGPNPSVQFKLVSVPQMNYLTTQNPPKGQICNRGASIFSEYYKDEKNTKQTVDSDGWNHSGDIGIILPNGALKIIDRKKNIFKLSQGEYIAPEKIENIYLRYPYIAECFIYGDSLESYVVAIVHPNLEALVALAKKLSINETSPSKLCQNTKITQFILGQMTQHAKKEGLHGFETAKKLRLWPVSFGTLGIFTSTMKLQRHTAKEVFKNEIKQMYSSK